MSAVTIGPHDPRLDHYWELPDRERFALLDARLAHDRMIAPLPTPEMARAFALDLVRRKVAAASTPELIDWHLSGGGCGPARDGRPRYAYGFQGFPVFPSGQKAYWPKSGELAVVLGEDGADVMGRYRIADLMAEIRSGSSQLSLFEVTP